MTIARILLYELLEDTAHYAGFLQAPVEDFSLQPRILLVKTRLIMLFWPTFGYFWCSRVTLVTFKNSLN